MDASAIATWAARLGSIRHADSSAGCRCQHCFTYDRDQQLSRLITDCTQQPDRAPPLDHGPERQHAKAEHADEQSGAQHELHLRGKVPDDRTALIEKIPHGGRSDPRWKRRSPDVECECRRVDSRLQAHERRCARHAG